jgi:geranylgeranylglycerol-phosphate geranylgeranyltransferase
MTATIGRKKPLQGNTGLVAGVAFVRSQLILFNSRKKFGLLYCLATLAGVFCVPGVINAISSEAEILQVIRGILPLPFVSLLVSVGMYILNDLVDANLDRTNAKDRPIPSGRVSKRQAWAFIVLTNGIGIMLAAGTSNLASFVLVVPMLLIGILYSAPKVALMKRFVIKNMVIAVFYMLCVLLGVTSSYGIESAISKPVVPIHAMVVFGIMIFVGSIVNDLGDVKGDKAAGRRTIPIVLGGKSTLSMLIILLICIPAVSWTLYVLAAGAGSIVTAIATSFVAGLALARMTRISKVLQDAESVRRQHKKWFPLHMVLQTSFVIGAILLI